MTRWAIQICLVVVAMVGGATASLAAECSNDPNECTPKKLCEVATEISDGNKLWATSTASSKHVSFAQELGMKCGVVALADPCDTDPNECKISQLCEKATTDNGGTKSWSTGDAEGYVAVAKEYGLACGVIASVEKNCDLDMLDGCTTEQLCKKATFTINGKTDWKQGQYKNYGNEAKNRGLSCGVKAVQKIETAAVCTGDAETLGACSDIHVCALATYKIQGRYIWASKSKLYYPSVVEAQRRGLTCGGTLDFRQAFISEPKLKRQQLQYALKKLNFYSYGIDGLWGKGTKAGFDKFVDNVGLRDKSEREVFKALLSRVSVPSSFAQPKRTTSTSSSSSSNSTKKSYYMGMTPIIPNPSTSAEQAYAICKPQGEMAANQAENAYKNSKSSVDCSVIGSQVFCDKKSGSGGGFWGGFASALSANRAGKRASESIMKSCLAQYGWRD